MGTACAKAFGDMLLGNKTIQTLDVSDNGFGKMQVGEQVKLKSSGEMKVVTAIGDFSGGNTIATGPDFPKDYLKPSEYEWENQIPTLSAAVAASPSLISVSTIFRYALAVSISHSSPHPCHVRSSMLPRTPWARPAPRSSGMCSW